MYNSAKHQTTIHTKQVENNAHHEAPPPPPLQNPENNKITWYYGIPVDLFMFDCII